jgi:hypothetical protein
MRARGDERIRMSALVLIVVVLVVRLSYDAAGSTMPLRSYALVSLAIALGTGAIVAIAATALPRSGKTARHLRGRIVTRKRSGSGRHTIHLN